MALKKCNKPCFGNGSECYDWIERNCDICVKGSRYDTKKDRYTKIRCSIQDDIFAQDLGSGNDAIRQKSYDATRTNNCPYFIPLGTYKTNKNKVTTGQLTLFDS